MQLISAALLAAARHLLRGASATLALGTAVSTVSAIRSARLTQLPKPSRDALAIAVFVGVFRLIDRYKCECEPWDEKPPTSKPALVAATVLGGVYLRPDSRTPLISLVATNAVTTWFQKLLGKHPELAVFKPMELLIFLALSGWIFYSGFFHPESYDPTHLKALKRYSLTPETVHAFLTSQYAQGRNPSPCEVRHSGRACGEFACTTFLPRSLTTAVRIYAPVHVATWLLALRHRAVRAKPVVAHLRSLAQRILQSALYYIVYVVVGWTMACYTNAIGSRSLAWRKRQFLLCGSLPALAIGFESESRRRPIAVMLCSYAFVSMGTVLSQQHGFRWLQRGSGPVRTLLDVIVASSAVAYTFGELIEGNAVLQRVLKGETTK